MCSIKNKISDLEVILSSENPDFFCVTEHWLPDSAANTLNMTGYKSSAFFGRKERLHGGVAIYVRETLVIKDLTNNLSKYNNEFHYECAALSYTVKNICVIILCVYRSPNGNLNIFLSHLQACLTDVLNRYRYIVLVGDLNIDSRKNDISKKLLFDIFAGHELTSYVDHPTRTVNNASTTIDYIVSNIQHVNAEVIDFGISDHTAQMANISLELNSTDKALKQKPQGIPRRSVSQNHLLNLYNILAAQNWQTVYNYDNVDQAFQAFANVFELSLNSACPKTITKPSCQKKVSWITPDLIRERSQLHDLFKLKCEINSAALSTLYKSKKKSYYNRLENAKRAFFGFKIANSSNETREVWKIVNERLGRSQKTKELTLCVKEEKISEPLLVSNIFAAHFSKLAENKLKSCVKVLSKKSTIPPINMNTLFMLPTDKSEIIQHISSLNNTKSAGIDDITAEMLKLAAEIIAGPISHIVNLCFQTGSFPDALKTARVVPVFKKGDNEYVNNYRPISVLSNISKIMEKAIAKRILNFADKHNLISDSQHGFRNGRSTETACFDFVQFVYDSLDKNLYVAGIFFDLSCAFDSINPAFLKNKLKAMGIRGTANNLISSYMMQRKLLVSVSDAHSNRCNLHLGVPQGSVLGPLLYILFANDVVFHVESQCQVSFADDTSFAISASTATELKNKVSTLVKNFKNWCDQNNLIVNVEKTAGVYFYKRRPLPNLSFNCNNTIIVPVNSVKLLGVNVDSNLSWVDHIEGTCCKLNKAFFALRNIKECLNEHQLIQVYFAMVQSILSYNLILWGTSVEINRVFILQKKIVRMMFNIRHRDTCKHTFQGKNILTIFGLLIYKCSMYVKKNINKFSFNNQIHDHNTRRRNEIHIENYNLTLYNKSPETLCAAVYNRLDDSIKNIRKIDSFKEALKTYLISKSHYKLNEYMR